MKVNTDSCIFGAVVNYDHPTRILDIGTGSGLLALMMAQRFKEAIVDAIEPDAGSADQAELNFRISPWPYRIRLHKTDVEHFTEVSQNRYDLIIANPPWFENSLKSGDERKNKSRHMSTLTWEKLSQAVKSLLNSEGVFYILLPSSESGKFKVAIESEGFILIKQILIKNSGQESTYRIVSGFTLSNFPFNITSVVIKNAQDCYTAEFKALLKDFYLAF